VLLVKVSSYLYSAVSRSQDFSKSFTLLLADLFNRTSSQLLWKASSPAAVNTQIPITVYSQVFIQLSELEHCTVEKNFPMV